MFLNLSLTPARHPLQRHDQCIEQQTGLSSLLIARDSSAGKFSLIRFQEALKPNPLTQFVFRDPHLIVSLKQTVSEGGQ